jgi:hypothetical protein
MGWWSVAGWLVIAALVSAVSAPLWAPLALNGDVGKGAKEAAAWGWAGLLGLFGLWAVVVAVGAVVEQAKEARREAKEAGWGPQMRSVRRGVLRGAAVVVAMMLAVETFQEVARPVRWVDCWFRGWPADEGVVWDAVWVGGRLALIGACLGVLALAILAVAWVFRRCEKLAAWKQERVLDWLGALALAALGWLAWRYPVGAAFALIALGVIWVFGSVLVALDEWNDRL